MANDANRTVRLLIDPCNVFLSEGGKRHPAASTALENVNGLGHFARITAAMQRAHGISGPARAHAIVSTDALLAAWPSP